MICQYSKLSERLVHVHYFQEGWIGQIFDFQHEEGWEDSFVGKYIMRKGERIYEVDHNGMNLGRWSWDLECTPMIYPEHECIIRRLA